MKGRGWFIGGGIVLAIFAVLAIWLGPLVSAALRAGFLDKAEDRTLQAGETAANLKALHQSLVMYAESEGTLPEASGWMDAAYTRLKTADLPEDEAKKQLKARTGLNPDEYGYAMNKALSRKDPFDESLKDQILIFESESLAWNATGDPSRDSVKGRRAQSITLSGSLKPLLDP